MCLASFNFVKVSDGDRQQLSHCNARYCKSAYTLLSLSGEQNRQHLMETLSRPRCVKRSYMILLTQSVSSFTLTLKLYLGRRG